jgi:cell division protease FtsH
LGKELASPRDFSEKLQEEVDHEVSLILKAQYRRAYDIISSERETLTRLAEAVLEKETLDSLEIDQIVGVSNHQNA